ncbi:MAG: 3-oxoacyl-ACP synthase III [Lentisphaerae bacterium]|jgi:acyl-CoA:acyl-CoA alkyltransferase|nr:3-oxoacyl-ACP synthase III [Lentisphaerota bacterium]MBT4814121.1 3-oxoacyl-ACP synthase III [Lentisphaerota bacterium]MBT5606128.1 3-oxoacyl-ACP synthase III [Lentisphaerota bacterium]MBT7060199.1 3-oxoacyl-ACP synthase III [Lentisphaerota bacterium]MBT7840421.1 3-oxoacyl-ACP synthase III [Lentisphaerota bacterium]
MRYTDVCVEAISHVLPSRAVSSDTVEKWLKPLYDRLHLPEGRLELISGIKERRMWKRGTRPSEVSARAGEKALKQAGLLPSQLDCLFHCSVSRDFVEPATSTTVHRLLGLPGKALNLDISNACLGVLSGMIMLANMIQLGQAQAGVIVSGEQAQGLMDGTIEELVNDTSLTRKDIKSHFASLTIGSAAAAVVLTHRSMSKTGRRLLGGAHLANTKYNHLCQGSAETGMSNATHANMQTDAEQLLAHGIELAEQTWELAKQELDWDNDTPDCVCCHQVGRAHREQLYEHLNLDLTKDFSTFEHLGNCGSASLPVTTAMAVEAERLKRGDKLAMLGIGSGINCTMLGVEW